MSDVKRLLGDTSDADLVKLARAEVSALCKGRQRDHGKDWTMHIPVQPHDSDIVFGEVIDRFDALQAKYDALTAPKADVEERLATMVSEGEGLWWCPACGEWVNGVHVTYDDKHERCGCWVGERFDTETKKALTDALSELQRLRERLDESQKSVSLHKAALLEVIAKSNDFVAWVKSRLPIPLVLDREAAAVEIQLQNAKAKQRAEEEGKNG